MTPKLDTSTFKNPADEAALKATTAAIAAGEDPFGDDDQDEDVGEADDQGAEDDADEADSLKTDSPDSKEDDTEAATEPAEAAFEAGPAETAPVYITPPLAELDAQRTTLRAEKEKAFAEFDEGAINRDEYLAIERRVDDQIDDLIGQRALLQANEQARVAGQQAKLTQIRETAKKDGTIDYATEDAGAEFDAALTFVAAVKANARLGFDALADKAHAMVLAQRGVVAKPAAQPGGKPAPRMATPGPVTLAGIPAAATTGTTGTVGDRLSRLSGLAFQDAIGAMPKAQRDAYMDS